MRELSRESEGYDIKLGPGGIEEIEFIVQYLQLNNCGREKRLLVQGTVKALDRLRGAGFVEKEDAVFLKDTYLFYRTLESFLRLRGENILGREETKLRSAAEFIGFEGAGELIDHLEGKRERTKNITAPVSWTVRHMSRFLGRLMPPNRRQQIFALHLERQPR